MADLEDHIKDLLDSLKQQRDELAVQIHLGKKEAQQEWENLEEKWEQFKSQSKPILGAAGESAKNVGAALELAGDELKKGYQRIRKLLES